jgi:nitrite reductase/ring-hydroxylating ferredoxin subunit
MNEKQLLTRTEPDDAARDSSRGPDRRTFLKLAGFAVAVGTVGLETTARAYEGPQLAVGKGSVDLGAATSLKVGGVIDRSADLKLIVTRTAQGLIAVSTQCTHDGCNSAFSSGSNQLVCPCHGARFSVDGTRLRGPARAPLSTYPIQVKAGRLIVNTNRITQRQSVQAKDFQK